MAIQITHAALYDGNPFDGGEEIERVKLDVPVEIGAQPNPVPGIEFWPVPRPVRAWIAFLEGDSIIYAYDGTLTGIKQAPTFHGWPTIAKAV